MILSKLLPKYPSLTFGKFKVISEQIIFLVYSHVAEGTNFHKNPYSLKLNNLNCFALCGVLKDSTSHCAANLYVTKSANDNMKHRCFSVLV